MINSNNNNNNHHHFLVPGDTGKIGTRTLIFLVQTAHGFNLAARWSKENTLDSKKSRYSAKLHHEILFCYEL